jgi:hypothetical protein
MAEHHLSPEEIAKRRSAPLQTPSDLGSAVAGTIARIDELNSRGRLRALPQDSELSLAHERAPFS